MSVKDLIANWEEALALALSQPDDQDPVSEMHDDDLTNVADLRIARMRVRSNVVAGVTFGCTIQVYLCTIDC